MASFSSSARSVLGRFSLVLDADTSKAVRQFVGAASVLVAFERVVTGVVGAIKDMVDVTAQAGDSAAVQADEVGLSAEAWQEYAWAAKIAGTSVDRLRTALRRMGDNAIGAQRGAGQAVNAFAEIFGSVDNMPKSQDELFTRILKHFQDMGNSAEAIQRKGGLMAQIFGRAGAKSAALFKLGPEMFAKLRQEARDLGMVISEDLARATQKYNDELLRLKGVWTGLQYTVGSRLLPQATSLVLITREWAVEQRSLILAGLEPWLRLVESGLNQVKWVIDRLQRGIRQFIGPIEWLTEAFSWMGMAVAVGGTLVLGVMFLAGAVSLLGTAFTFVSTSMAAFYAVAAPFIWPVLAIAGVFVMAAVAVDDFITFLRGGKSVLGDFLEKTDSLADFWSAWNEIKGIFEDLEPYWESLKIYMTSLSTIMDNQLTPAIQRMAKPLMTLVKLFTKLTLWQAKTRASQTRQFIEGTATGVEEMQRRSPADAFKDTMQWLFGRGGPMGEARTSGKMLVNAANSGPSSTLMRGSEIDLSATDRFIMPTTTININGVHDPEAVAAGVLEEANRISSTAVNNREM